MTLQQLLNWLCKNFGVFCRKKIGADKARITLSQ